MIIKKRYLTWCIILIIVTASAVTFAQDQPAASVKESDLIAVLQSNAPAAERAFTCKQLAIYGTEQSVPAIAPLLADKELASWARIALEAIPGPAADAALRDAMSKLEGRLLVGAINSIAVRRDAQAVDALVQKLGDANADVASAAAVALGHIGGQQAAKALIQSLTDAPPGVRSAAAEGCILCAERFMADNRTAEAITLYDTVRQADVPDQRHIEAIRGAILARSPAAFPC
jgi:HEAT repeat protein